MLDRKIFRVIDANLNRSREGLRVCEEVARFILNSSALTGELKTVRHSVSNAQKDLSCRYHIMLLSRDSKGDVGRRLTKAESEICRKDPKDIFEANIERAKESLRVLEEFSKLIDKKVSDKFLRLRFKVYDIEKRSLKKIGSLRDTG